MLRLLIVDDELIIREAISEMVDYMALGYELIGTAKNGMEAYDIICDEYPDVVITDIRMPILDGLSLIEKARKSDQQIIFVILSGYGEFEYARKAMKFGVNHYLLKPTMRQELIDTLTVIRKDFQTRDELKKKEQEKILQSFQSPLKQSFIRESLESVSDFKGIFTKYQRLMVFPEDCRIACLCSFVEESYLNHFVRDVDRLLASLDSPAQYPVLYVRNTAVIIAPLNTISLQEKFKNALMDLRYPGQSTTFEPRFLRSQTCLELFETVIKKISRYEKILLFTENNPCELYNTLHAPHKIRQLSQTGDIDKKHLFLDTIFPDFGNMASAKSFALNLFLAADPDSTRSTELACDFFKKLHSCTSIDNVQTLLQAVLFTKSDSPVPKAGNITLLKNYVEHHLDSEVLSLKWIAENYLFMHVGYLSKQFIKEEGMRFSEYLNKKRMEEAIHLMVYYQNDNIKDIAKQVGFGNNPQYFSQVFKKYTGSTPSDYIENIKYKMEEN